MEEQLANRSHFFKVLIPGFHQKLNLPPAFCKKLKQEKSEWVMLKSRKGTSRIKVCRNSEGLISLKFGWPQFVDNHSLHVGDFLVFEHVGGLNFNVLVFDPSCCEKEFLVQPKTGKEYYSTDHDEAVKRRRIHKANKREIEKESEVISFDSKTPHFITTFSPFHAKEKSQLNIPIEFARSNNLGKKTNVAALRNEHGQVWHTCLYASGVGRFRVSLRGKGWRDFYVSNELKPGDICVFYLNPDSPRSGTILFDVKIFPSSV